LINWKLLGKLPDDLKLVHSAAWPGFHFLVFLVINTWEFWEGFAPQKRAGRGEKKGTKEKFGPIV